MKYILFLILLLYSSHYILAQEFNFNNGNRQNWFLSGPFDENDSGPYSSNFSSLEWIDSSNYPNNIGSDPNGDNNGAIRFHCESGHGINESESDYWIMQFHSPNLDSLNIWQNMNGYHVQIYQNIGSVWANLFVTVYDSNQSTERYFYNGTAQVIQSGEWQNFTFTDLTSIEDFPSSYSVLRIHINIWGEISGYYDGSVYLDNVFYYAIDDISNNKVMYADNFMLYQNYPNPFNSETMIKFNISHSDHIRLDIFNVLGMHIRTLVDERRNHGTFYQIWDGLDEKGRSVPTGIYFYRLMTSNYFEIKKLMIIE